jgi:hypothetical protein
MANFVLISVSRTDFVLNAQSARKFIPRTNFVLSVYYCILNALAGLTNLYAAHSQLRCWNMEFIEGSVKDLTT